MSEIVTLHVGDSASLDPTQSGFAHGFGLFETLKLEGRRLHFWAAHWGRLCRSAKAFDLSVSVDAEAVLTAIRNLVESDALRHAIIKISLLEDGDETRVFVYARPAIARPLSAALWIDSTHLLNQHSPLAGHKTHNYMENMLLLRSSKLVGFDDVIRLNTDRDLAETTVGNLFFVAGGKLCTPALATGILPGVIRAEVLAAARGQGVQVEEGLYTIEALKAAEAAFITNSSVGILPVAAIKGGGIELSLASQAHALVSLLTSALAISEEKCSTQL
jgi:branched-subunit amino acid aminotransferase/4-amino-4-deoxychorismate lyase